MPGCLYLMYNFEYFFIFFFYKLIFKYVSLCKNIHRGVGDLGTLAIVVYKKEP